MTIEKFTEALDDVIDSVNLAFGFCSKEKREAVLALYAEALADAETVRLARSFSKRQPGTVEWSIAALYLHEHINRETK